MADLTWKRSEIRDELRELIGMPGTSGLSNTVLDARINDFYLNIFPGDAEVQELESWYTFDTADDDDCEQALPASIYTVSEPMTLKDSDDIITPLDFHRNKDKFFTLHPEDSTDEDAERGTPRAVLLYGRTLILRPKADEVFTFKAASIIKPTAFTGETSVPLDVRWGPAIAQGTAVLVKNRAKDLAAAADLDSVYQAMIKVINRRDLKQMTTQRAMPRF